MYVLHNEMMSSNFLHHVCMYVCMYVGVGFVYAALSADGGRSPLRDLVHRCNRDGEPPHTAPYR